MKNGIKMSKKHGVNPTIPVCFFCGEEKNELALLGHIRTKNDSDAEAPPHMLLDYEPCDKCKEQMDKGITLIGVRPEPVTDDQPPIGSPGGQPVYPTSSWCVVSEDFIRRNITDDTVVDQILDKRKSFIEEQIIQEIIKANNSPKEDK